MDLTGKVDHLIQLTTSLKGEITELKDNDLNERFGELEKETNDLKNELNEMRYTLMKQNAKIVALILRSSDKAECGQGFGDKLTHCSGKFPLKNLGELNDLENSISFENIDAIVTTMKQFLTHHGGLVKNIHTILSTELMLELNVDGTQNKKRLLNYYKFMDALFQAAFKEGYTKKEFLDDVQNGMRKARRQYSQEKSRNRLILKEMENQVDNDDEFEENDEAMEDEDEKETEFDDETNNDWSSQSPSQSQSLEPDSVFKIFHLN